MANTPTTGQSAALFIPAAVSLLSASGAAADIRAQSRAVVANIESAGRSLVFSQHAKAQQFKELDRVIGDKLSASGLETMKREARLRAASAETGVSGKSSEEAIGEAYMEENFRTASILREADIAKHSLKQSMVADMLSFDNEVSSLKSGMRSSSSALLNVLGAGLGGFSSGLNLLNTTQKDRLFSTDTGTELPQG